MSIYFVIVAAITLTSAAAAMFLRNLVHCALSLAVAFAGFAMLYLQLGAEFIGFAQVLVYLGAVAILVVFAILLTRGGDSRIPHRFGRTEWVGASVATGVAIVMIAILSGTELPSHEPASVPAAEVAAIGHRLMGEFVLPLEILGVLLTAALIGAVLIARPDSKPKNGGDA